MELLATEQHFIIVDGDQSLWIDRHSQSLAAKTGADNEINNATCLGIVHGYLGKITFGSGLGTTLIFIRQKSLVGILDGCEIFKVLSVLCVPLETDIELILEGCPKHTHVTGDPTNVNAHNTMGLLKLDNNIRTPISVEYIGQRNLYKVKVGPVSPTFGTEKVSPLLRKNDRKDKVEKKIVDEFHKMFTDADSFYYSPKYDLTNTIQRQFLISEISSKSASDPQQPNERHEDRRFIWNYHMIIDLIQSEETAVRRWITVLIHGFVEHGACSLTLDDGPSPVGAEKRDHIDLWLISRRSRFRAGTRYLRRGIDEHGKVANYVETEQIMIFQKHKTSFVQIRGSIPLYWSQSGQKYRPIPRLDRSEGETFAAFEKHCHEERSLYGPIIIVNLVDKTGKEKILGDAYLSNVLKYNSPDMTYLSFDFHDHCRGMHFENVKLVISKLEDTFNAMSFCWVDSYGIVLQQKGVLRVNCVDCLDRTNLTQTQFGRHVLETQLSKLGLLAPEIGLAKNIKTLLQTMWANNGDIISKQYAGTNALKGDFTRTGERKLTSALKDGMNSANRYYLNRFRDIHRQAAIDITMGERETLTLTEDDLDDGKSGEEKESTVEQIKVVIDDVKKCVVPKQEEILGAWCFVNAKKNAPGETDIDTVFILTEECCFATEYDCALDSITETEAVKLEALRSLELGFEKTTAPTSILSLFSNTVTQTPHALVPCLRINYDRNGELCCHEFLSSNIQFSNNTAVHIQQPEDMLESLKLIAEIVRAAAATVNNPIKLHQSKFLEERASTLKPLTSSTSSVGFNLLEHDLLDHTLKTTTKRVSQPNDLISTNSLGSSMTSAKDGLTRGVSLKATKHQKGGPTTVNNAGVKPKRDIVLASCGVISSSTDGNLKPCVVRDIRDEAPVNICIPIVSGSEQIDRSREVHPIVSTPVDTHVVGLTLQPDPDSPVELSRSLLLRPRLSLPASDIQPHLPGRSITPEIKITEVQQNSASQFGDVSNSKLGIPGLTKRMSRSSEDMSNELETDEHKENVGVGGNQKLSPTFSKENRSSSIQNLFNSALNMKSSRSENTILARPNSARIAVLNPLSKDSVLVPLGKLAKGMQKGANYFDPRKLKDTFRPGTKNLQDEAQRKEEKEYLLAIEERKKNCKSIIIEI